MKINANAAANIWLQLAAIAMLLILIVCQVTSEYRHTGSSRAFRLLLYVSTATICLDTITWIFDGWPGRSFHALLWITTFLLFSMSIPLALTLCMYIAACIPVERRIEQRIVRIGVPASGIYILIVGLLQCNELIYSINESNLYVQGPLYWLPGTIFSLLAFGAVVFTRSFRDTLGVRKTLTLMSYSLFPIAGFIANMFLQESAIGNLFLAMSLFIIFVNIQVRQERKLLEREAELTKAHTAIMLSQIQPHFLYNALSAIGDLCYENAQAHEAVIRFSDYLRTNMDSLSHQGLIPFQQEMEHVQQYLWLETLRFEERLQVVWHIEAVDFRLPALTLQPVVENSVRHGVTKRRNGGTITIRTCTTQDGVCIIVMDDGVGFGGDKSLGNHRGHIGISNVRKRLEVMCGGRLAIESEAGKGTTVTIKIPARGETMSTDREACADDAGR